jgi:hypothetical protein
MDSKLLTSGNEEEYTDSEDGESAIDFEQAK